MKTKTNKNLHNKSITNLHNKTIKHKNSLYPPFPIDIVYTWKGEETRRCPFAGALRRPRWKESQRLTPFLVEHYLVKWQRIK